MLHILEKMKEQQENIEKDMAHLIELKIETEETLKEIIEKRDFLKISRNQLKSQSPQTKIVTHRSATQTVQDIQENKSSSEITKKD